MSFRISKNGNDFIYNAVNLQGIPLDKNVSNPEINQILKYNGTGWVNATGFSATGIHYSDYVYWNTATNSWTAESDNRIHIGSRAGRQNQANLTVAVGSDAGLINQGGSTVAVGRSAGSINQGGSTVAVGSNAGSINQGGSTVAVGSNAGSFVQGDSSVAVGFNAGDQFQGGYSIAIGYKAGETNQHPNSIILNANTGPLNSSSGSAFYVNPIRNDNATGYNLCYEPTTSEIVYNTSKTFVIQHPEYESKYLVHACLEGPEAGVYYRGEGCTITKNNIHYTTITLPSYVSKLATELNVITTPVLTNIENEIPILATTSIYMNTFKVVSNKPTKFNWLVMGKRKSIQVEVEKSEVVLKGDGPYKYI